MISGPQMSKPTRTRGNVPDFAHFSILYADIYHICSRPPPRCVHGDLEGGHLSDVNYEKHGCVRMFKHRSEWGVTTFAITTAGTTKGL